MSSDGQGAAEAGRYGTVINGMSVHSKHADGKPGFTPGLPRTPQGPVQTGTDTGAKDVFVHILVPALNSLQRSSAGDEAITLADQLRLKLIPQTADPAGISSITCSLVRVNKDLWEYRDVM